MCCLNEKKTSRQWQLKLNYLKFINCYILFEVEKKSAHTKRYHFNWSLHWTERVRNMCIVYVCVILSISKIKTKRYHTLMSSRHMFVAEIKSIFFFFGFQLGQNDYGCDLCECIEKRSDLRQKYVTNWTWYSNVYFSPLYFYFFIHIISLLHLLGQLLKNIYIFFIPWTTDSARMCKLWLFLFQFQLRFSRVWETTLWPKPVITSLIS